MAATDTFTTSTGHKLELRRPNYKSFKNIATKVAALMDVEFETAMSVPEFAQVLNACVTQQLGDPSVEDDDGILSNLPYTEAARLWDAVIKHCEFESFFAERRKQRSESLILDQELQAKLLSVQFKTMKETGMLPADYSIETLLAEQMNVSTTPTLLSSTTTPADTGGDGQTSNEPTTGGSRGTSPKPSNAGKRKSN